MGGNEAAIVKEAEILRLIDTWAQLKASRSVLIS
jgi:hypothetical protein